jgi:preprotein translocase SecE subunit
VVAKSKQIIEKLEPTTEKIKTIKIVNKPLRAIAKIGSYFKDSWIELKQVRWPDRKATWSMTLAVILFSGFFIVVILLLDYGFDKLFKLIIK